MTRFGFVLLLTLWAVPVSAEPTVAPPGLNSALMTQIYAAALGFITPRTLEPIGVPQLTIWGMRGLTALDPDLAAGEMGGQLVLFLRRHLLYAGTPPPKPSPTAWASVAVAMTRAGWDASAPVRQAGTEGIIQAFFDEMFNHLDPYSRYVPPGQAAEEQALLAGSAGAGMTLRKRGRAVVVEQVVPQGPAATAGIRAGDHIVSVGDQPTAGQTATVVSGWIAGPEFSTVRIVWRTRAGRVRTAEIVRVLVPPDTVFPNRLADMLLLRVTRFSSETSVAISAAIEAALATRHPPAGLVFDLRGNRGGLLAESAETADELLPPGLIAIERGRDPEATRIWRSSSGELARDVPVIVVVDGRTASAAEVLAAALADRGRAVVVGSTTLGKGLVQTFTSLPGGGELYVTWSRLLAPLGWPIQGLGVLPQVCTSLGQAMLERQLAALTVGRQPLATAIARARAARAPVPPAEAVAIRDACPAAVGREIDLEAAHYLIDNPTAYAAALLPPFRGGIANR